jgi:hypothetical protein
VIDALILLFIKSGHISDQALWILCCRKSHAYTEYNTRYWSTSTEFEPSGGIYEPRVQDYPTIANVFSHLD